MRGQDLLAVLRGGDVGPQVFHPTFLKEVPANKVREIADSMRAQYGQPIKIIRTDRKNAHQASIYVEYERATARLDVTLSDGTEGSRVTGLFISDIQLKGDSIDAVLRDMQQLPGTTAIGVWRVTATGLEPLSTWNAGKMMAVGSSFKLAVLAALDADIRAGKRRWSDVVPLTHKSLPSGQTQNWPDRAPMTLHSLATLMISISDNSATDTLLHYLGRAHVDGFLKQNRIVSELRHPTLSTLEAFVLKEPGQAALRRQWDTGDYASRVKLLQENQQLWSLGSIKAAMMAGKPQSIATVEWFYSAEEMAHLLQWLSVNGSPEALAIMAINPGIAPSQRSDWEYAGYKGGSETGVIAMNYLLTDQRGQKFAVSAAWNNSAAAVADDTFFQLVGRVTSLLIKR